MDKKIIYGVIAIFVITIAAVFLLNKGKEKVTGLVVTNLGDPTGDTPVSAVHGETITASNTGYITQNSCGAQQSGSTLTIVASKNNPSCTVIYENLDLEQTKIIVSASDNNCTPSDSCSPSTEGLLTGDSVDFITINPPEDPQDEKA